MKTLRQRAEDKERATGTTGWLLRQARKADERKLVEQQPWLADFAISDTALTAGDRELDLRGAAAAIETAGELRRRVTATRVAATGVFALLARKRIDDRMVYLTLEGPHVAEVRQYPAKQLDQIALRQFVADINRLAASS